MKEVPLLLSRRSTGYRRRRGSKASDEREVMGIVFIDVSSLRGCQSNLTCVAALAFSYVERIMRAPDVALAVATSISVLQSTLHMLKQAGFEPMVYEGMYHV